MNPLQFLFILKAHWKVALLVALVTITTGILGSKLLTKQYTADTAVMVDVRSPDPVATVLLPATMFPGNLGTQVDIIKSDRVARKVVAMLGLDKNQAVKKMWLSTTEGKGKLDDWMINLLQKGLTVTPARDSNIIDIAYRGTDPVFVAAVANAFAQAYIEASVELKVEPARQYAQWFGDQAKIMRENVELAQKRLTEYQQKSGIVGTNQSADYELSKLVELTQQLTVAQGETRDAQINQRSGAATVDTLKEVMGNSVLQSLRSDVIKREVELKELAGRLGVKHPEYQRKQAELAELKSRLAQETSHVASGYSTATAVGRTREIELKAAIEAQKAKILKLNESHDEIAVLMRDVETAKRAYEAITNRYNQTNLESHATQTNVTVLNPAIEPLEPSFPKPLPQTALMAVALGILLGCGAAFGLETLNRRIRSTGDLADMLQLPVLGVIARPKKRGRLFFARQTPALLPR